MSKKKSDFIENNPVLKNLSNIFDEFNDLLNNKEYDKVNERIKDFLDADINEMKTILVITKAFKDHSIIGEYRTKLRESFERKCKEDNIDTTNV